MRLYADVSDVPLSELYAMRAEIVSVYPRVIAVVGEVYFNE